MGWVDEAVWFNEEVSDWVRAIKKHVSDVYEVTYNEEKVVETVRSCTAKELGTYRIQSATDVEATFRNHGKDITFGYNVQVATDDAIVREVVATTGSTPDESGIPKLVSEQKKHRGYVPEQIVYDRAAGRAHTIGEVAGASDGETELVAKPALDESKEKKKKTENALFGTDEFQFVEEESEGEKQMKVICPNGVETTAYSLSGSGKGYNFRFRKKVECAGCPLMARCYENPEPDKQQRKSVFITFDRARLDKMRVYVKTDEGKALLKNRFHVERIIASLVNHNGARRAKRRGLKAADFQAKMAGMAHNAKWLVKQLLDKEKKQRALQKDKRRKGGVCLAPT